MKKESRCVCVGQPSSIIHEEKLLRKAMTSSHYGMLGMLISKCCFAVWTVFKAIRHPWRQRHWDVLIHHWSFYTSYSTISVTCCSLRYTSNWIPLRRIPLGLKQTLPSPSFITWGLVKLKSCGCMHPQRDQELQSPACPADREDTLKDHRDKDLTEFSLTFVWHSIPKWFPGGLIKR